MARHWRTQFLMRLNDIANQLNRIADHFEMQDESETAMRLREYKKGYEDARNEADLFKEPNAFG